MRRRAILTTSLILLLSALAAAAYFHTLYSVHVSSNKDVVEIRAGSSLKHIAATLSEHDIIASEYLFILSAKFSGNASKLQSGYYQFPEAVSTHAVLEILSAGSHQAVRTVSIPEGLTIRRMARLLSRRHGYSENRIVELCADRDFLNTLRIPAKTAEGYLLPETYTFRYDEDEATVLRTLARQMQAVFTDDLRTAMKRRGLSRHRILTMASIVEGETNRDSERARIAGVYFNRLRRGMLLQADPTVQYIIPDGPRRLLYSDLAIPSPYNTYRNAGLPPGPINNPGAASIRAAVFPEQHDYLYFVADGTGGHRFSRSLAEHNRAVAAYRKWRRARGE